MKRTTLAIGLFLGAAMAFAQAPEAPKPVDASKPKCEPKPEFPGRLGMQVDSKRKVFERDLKAYQDCMKVFVDDRKATIKANEAAANAAIEEFNSVMNKIRADQEAAR